MPIPEGAPRRSVEADPIAELMGIITDLRARVAGLERGASLRNASISGGDGLRVLDPDGGLRISLNTTDGAVVAYDGNGSPVARFGPLANSNPGQYGVEVFYNGAWAQVGAGNVDWGNITNKPSSYPPALPISGSDVSGTVSSASSASEATHAAQADGSSYAFNNNVGGTSMYAVWVGDDGGFHFGRNTSSIRYKTNVREHYTDPANVLALTPVLYDRLPAADGSTATADEFGLIAEEVYETFPELVTWFEGRIDGVRYDLLSVALLSVAKDQQARIEALEAAVANGAAYSSPAARPVSPNVDVLGPNAVEPPLPYSIQPQS